LKQARRHLSSNNISIHGHRIAAKFVPFRFFINDLWKIGGQLPIKTIPNNALRAWSGIRFSRHLLGKWLCFANGAPRFYGMAGARGESRLEALRASTTPLVGRDEEIDLLIRRWEQAKRGEGCLS
jgi:hypothetical protein